MSNPEHKKQLIQMAETWEMLAIARVKQLSQRNLRAMSSRARRFRRPLVVPVCFQRRSVLLGRNRVGVSASPSRR